MHVISTSNAFDWIVSSGFIPIKELTVLNGTSKYIKSRVEQHFPRLFCQQTQQLFAFLNTPRGRREAFSPFRTEFSELITNIAHWPTPIRNRLLFLLKRSPEQEPLIDDSINTALVGYAELLRETLCRDLDNQTRLFTPMESPTFRSLFYHATYQIRNDALVMGFYANWTRRIYENRKDLFVEMSWAYRLMSPQDGEDSRNQIYLRCLNDQTVTQGIRRAFKLVPMTGNIIRISGLLSNCEFQVLKSSGKTIDARQTYRLRKVDNIEVPYVTRIGAIAHLLSAIVLSILFNPLHPAYPFAFLLTIPIGLILPPLVYSISQRIDRVWCQLFRYHVQLKPQSQ